LYSWGSKSLALGYGELPSDVLLILSRMW
jgi:hypothetical protein